MHSSRMRTARLLTVSQHALDEGCISACTGQRDIAYPSMHWVGGVYPSMHWAWGVFIPACTGQGGCLVRGEVSALGGVCHTPLDPE